MGVVVAALQWLAFAAAVVLLYTGIFAYQDSLGRMRNRLVDWWIAVDELGEKGLSRHTAFLANLGASLARALDWLCGRETLSVRTAWVALNFSCASGCLFTSAAFAAGYAFLAYSKTEKAQAQLAAFPGGAERLQKILVVPPFLIFLACVYVLAACLYALWPEKLPRPLFQRRNALTVLSGLASAVGAVFGLWAIAVVIQLGWYGYKAGSAMLFFAPFSLILAVCSDLERRSV